MWSSTVDNSATLDGSILNGLLKSERGSEGPGLEELDAGYDAARQGSWAEAVQHYEKAAEAGSAEALALLGDCLYQGGVPAQQGTGPADVEKSRQGRGSAGHDRPWR